jgi:hypothetical protein
MAVPKMAVLTAVGVEVAAPLGPVGPEAPEAEIGVASAIEAARPVSPRFVELD